MSVITCHSGSHIALHLLSDEEKMGQEHRTLIFQIFFFFLTDFAELNLWLKRRKMFLLLTILTLFGW